MPYQSWILLNIRCHIHVHDLNSLIEMQFSLVAVLINAVIVINTVGHIGSLLYFCNQNTCSNTMYCPRWDKVDIALVDFNLLQVSFQRSRLHGFSQNFFRHLMLEAVNQVGPFFGVDDKPHLRLAIVTFVLICVHIIRVNLNGKILLCIDELHQYWKLTVLHLCSQILRVLL